MDKSQAKFIFTQALIQVGVVAVLAWSVFAFAGCARKNTNPPGALGQKEVVTTPAGAAASTGDSKNSHSDSIPAGSRPHTTAIKNGDVLLGRILKDKALLAYLASYQKKNSATCTPPSAGQIRWNCKVPTDCNFSLEVTCVSDILQTRDNDQLVRLSILGSGDSKKMIYKISDPAQTAAESKPLKLEIEF